MNSKKRSRNWILTINYKNNLPQNDNELLDYIKNLNGIKFTVFQLEQGEQGTQHHQAYVSFMDAKSFTTMKKLFPTAHIEPMRGTPSQAYKYCTKDDTRFNSPKEWGEIPKQGKRTDLERMYQMIKEGYSFTEIREDFPSQYIRYRNHLHTIKQELLEDEFKTVFRELDVIYLSDKPGVGKTRYVMEKYGYENVYRISNYKHPFDGYKGQEVIIFEEFRSSLPIEQMLNYLDGYPLSLPARYGDKVACYNKVYIISNWHFLEQYENIKRYHPDTYKAFDRRINFKGSLDDVIKYEEFKDIELPF